MTRFWRAVEQSPCLMEVSEVWRRRLETEFESLRRFFSVTDILATRFPGETAHRQLRVVADDHGIVAIDDETGEQNRLSRSDVVCHRLNVRALARELESVLGISARFEPLGTTHHTTRIGTLPSRLQSRPVYLDLNGTREGLRRAIEAIDRHAGRSYLLLHPTGIPVDSGIETWLRLTEGALVRLCDLVAVDEFGRFVARRDPQHVFSEAIGIEPELSPRYLFKLGGTQFRMLAFDSEPVIIKESVGLWYIAHLLANPDVPIEAPLLESLHTGIDPKIASGSKGERIDPQAKREYQSRLAELDAELEDARTCNASLRLAEIENERRQLIEAIRTSLGLGGRIREDFDADRSRKAVCKAIRRAIDAVEAEHPALARHLDGSIRLGLQIAYAPPFPIDWTL